MLSMFALISVSQILVFMNRESLSHNFYLRVRSWFWMLAALTLFVLLPISLMPLLIAFLAFWGSKEIATVAQFSTFTTWFFSTFITLSILLSCWSVELMLIVGITGLITISVCLFLLDNHRYLASGLTIISSLSFIILFMSCLFSLTLLISNPNNELSLGYTLYLIFSTQFNDAIQYFIGKKFGKKPLCSTISPNKTLEGAIGGCVIVSILATMVALYITPFSLCVAFTISIILTLLGVLGDIWVSWFKRQVGVKDMGTLIPGHGGVLDRIDSLLIATPVFLIIVESSIFY